MVGTVTADTIFILSCTLIDCRAVDTILRSEVAPTPRTTSINSTAPTTVFETVIATPLKGAANTCSGLIKVLLPDLIDAGFDILNPVQTSAANMDPRELKQEFGEKLSFWGGGVDTQRVLPFGTADEVRQNVRERFKIFGPRGGFVFNTLHNVQAGIPVENLLALYETVEECRNYPIQ